MKQFSKVHLVSGSTSSTGGIPQDANAIVEVHALGIRHRDIPALIAAAPEMLEALEIARIILDSTEGSAFNGEGSANFLRIKNAIAKARGGK